MLFFFFCFLVLSAVIIKCCFLYAYFSTNAAVNFQLTIFVIKKLKAKCKRRRKNNKKNSLNRHESHIMSLMCAIMHCIGHFVAHTHLLPVPAAPPSLLPAFTHCAPTALWFIIISLFGVLLQTGQPAAFYVAVLRTFNWKPFVPLCACALGRSLSVTYMRTFWLHFFTAVAWLIEN